MMDRKQAAAVKKKPETITFRPTKTSRALIDRVKTRHGIEFTARVINRAIVLANRDMLTDVERADPKVAAMLGKRG